MSERRNLGRRDPDRLIAAYFDRAAPELPERAFDAVRRDIHRTRQRLAFGPVHEPDVRTVARLLPIAAAIALLAALLALNLPEFGGPPKHIFESPLYRYSVVVPDGWTATAAAVRWDGESAPSLGRNVDQITGPHLITLGYAGPFSGDLAAFVQDRIAANARDHSDTCPTDALISNQPITIGGQPGVLLTLDCGAQIDQAMTVHDGIAYAFTIRDLTFATSLDAAELGRIRSMLDSLQFPKSSP